MARASRTETNGITTDSRYVAVAMGLFAAVPVAVQYLTYRFGAESGTLWYDAEQHWLPIARRLANGKVLYLSAGWDNKTPLWHGLNYLSYLTGEYALVLLTLVGIANAAVAYLLWVWLRRAGYAHGGLIAGALYLSAVPLMNADIINVRSFSLVFLLLALLTVDGVKRGVYTAISVLFSQVAVVAIPVLLYDGIRRKNTVRWSAQYIISGLVIGAIPFVVVGLIWSPEAMIAGLKFSFLSAGEYVLDHRDVGNPFLFPLRWAKTLVTVGQTLAFVLVPAGVSVAYMTVSDWRWNWMTYTVATLLAGCFFVTVLLKALTYYWMPVVTFAAAMVGIGVERWVGESSRRTERNTETERE